MGLRALSVIAFTALSVGPTSSAAQGDVENGSKVFKKCKACHQVGPKAKQRVGPVLNGILNSPAGQVEGFRYSKALKAAAEEGLQWTPESLDQFLADPKGFLPKTKMSFRGLKSAEDRTDVIAYLASFAPDGSAAVAPVQSSFVVPAEILALEGDAEYGEYLSGECTTCHQLDGGDDGIPTIAGWNTADFVTAMHAYRGGHREHPVMQMISQRLADDEIAALAAYFSALEN